MRADSSSGLFWGAIGRFLAGLLVEDLLDDRCRKRAGKGGPQSRHMLAGTEDETLGEVPSFDFRVEQLIVRLVSDTPGAVDPCAGRVDGRVAFNLLKQPADDAVRAGILRDLAPGRAKQFGRHIERAIIGPAERHAMVDRQAGLQGRFGEIQKLFALHSQSSIDVR